MSNGKARPIKYVSADADARLIALLESSGYDVQRVATDRFVSPGLSNHPDIFMCRLGIEDSDEIFFSGAFAGCGGELGPKYPADVAYNATCTGRYFIHNLKHTNPALLARARELGMEMTDVRQGYTKCSTVIVDENSIITYDKSIALPCERAGMDVLLIRPGHVLLSGYDTGLIGGASGIISEAGRRVIVFNGDLDVHPDATRMRDFITEHHVGIVTIPEYPLTDIGSII